MNGTVRLSKASKSAFRLPFASSSTRRGDVRTRFARNSANSMETSFCRFSKRPCNMKGPTFTGSTGSKMSLMAIQFVMYPTKLPATGSVQFLGTMPQRNICHRPKRNPNISPELTRNSSSLCPTFRKSSTRTLLSRKKALVTTCSMSRTLSTSRCSSETTRLRKKGRNGLMIAAQTWPFGASLRMASSMDGCSKAANVFGSKRPKASVRLRSFLVTMSVRRCAIFSAFVGTTPCQQNKPYGESLGRQSSGPQASSMG
mmetsp:Transcript_108743/g.318143  ORF Transcript_108743/g.318143 Transcript_108743/m.318143 type:complete len:257 (-) Transcript_108743:332-1102(-)